MTNTQSASAVWQEAMSELTNAVNALDQAHSLLKDIGWDDYITTKSWGRFVNLSNAVDIADGLLRDMQSATCPDCCAKLDGNDACLENDCPEVKR